MKLKLPKLLQNKYLLYVVLVIAMANVLGYLAKEKYNSVTFFLAIGLLSSYFTKNMTVDQRQAAYVRGDSAKSPYSNTAKMISSPRRVKTPPPVDDEEKRK